jgi:hypothetical protein
MSSTNYYGSIVYDIIFVGGMVLLSNSTLSELTLELRQEEQLLVLLQVVLLRLILP